MKLLIPAATLCLIATAAGAQTPRRDYLSCDLTTQRALKGTIGGTIKDAGQAHIATRVDILQADIGNARKARRLTGAAADALWRRAAAVRHDSDAYTRKQGFLSAAERASYDRALDAIAGKVCAG